MQFQAGLRYWIILIMIENKIKRPHIIIVIARGEAVRNFIFSDFLKEISQHSKVTILTNLNHVELKKFSKPFCDRIIQFQSYKENALVIFFREIIHTSHYQWLWSEAAKYYWGRHNARVKGNIRQRIKLYIWRIFGRVIAFRSLLRICTRIEQWLSWKLRPTKDFDHLFNSLKPDLVFNCSHIHGVKADLPMRVASGMGITTSVFIFSWDNLTSRSRIFPPYDYYLLWNEEMSGQLIEMYYPDINLDQVHTIGSPQFDFHFNPCYVWEKEKLFNEVGLDINRSYILYTTGMASDFPHEHKIVQSIIKYIKKIKIEKRPQLVVRTYVKGTSEDMLLLSKNYQNDKDIFFPPILWDPISVMPLNKDLYVYSNLIRFTSLGINTASTVTLELMMHKKPAINIGFEPPGSNLPNWSRFSRHVDYEHYLPVVASGAIMLARSISELNDMIQFTLDNPHHKKREQQDFIDNMFDGKIEESSASRASNTLYKIARISDLV